MKPTCYGCGEEFETDDLLEEHTDKQWDWEREVLFCDFDNPRNVRPRLEHPPRQVGPINPNANIDHLKRRAS